MPRVLLIDDEPGARAELRWHLESHPGYVVAGEAATFDEAVALLRSAAYDLVLLDIQLVGGTGFDAVPAIAPTARVIFVTAFDQHALRAFEVNALDYLLKPVSSARFAAALARYAAAPAAATRAAAPNPLRLDDRILLRLDSAHERFVGLADIRSIASCENYTEVLLVSGEKLLVRRTMKAWDDILPPEHFGRVHRTVIVALAQIERIVRLNRAALEVHLRGQRDPLPVSYRLVADLRAKLGARWPQE